MTEVQEEEEARIVTEETRGQDHLGGHEARQHIPRSEEDQDRGPGLQLGEGRGPGGQYRDQDRTVLVKIRIWGILRI